MCKQDTYILLSPAKYFMITKEKIVNLPYTILQSLAIVSKLTSYVIYVAGGNANDIANLKDNLAVSYKLKRYTFYWVPCQCNCPRERET